MSSACSKNALIRWLTWCGGLGLVAASVGTGCSGKEAVTVDPGAGATSSTGATGAGAALGITCPAGQAPCSSGCASLASDPTNCGACGNACGAGQSCAAGECTCQAGYTNCTGVCVDLKGDVANCGACGEVCGTGEVCAGTAGCQCQDGRVSCNDACVDTQANAQHCGGCDIACALGEVCSTGVCKGQCDAGLAQCGNVCVSLNDNEDHCGTCDSPCPAGSSCTNGSCDCGAGYEDCGGVCITASALDTDPNNCGACGVSCPSGADCVGGECLCAGADLEVCGNACVNTRTDSQNCGSCGSACRNGESCNSGQCVGSDQATGGRGGTGGVGGDETGGADNSTGGVQTTSCSSDADCGTNAYCDNGTCACWWGEYCNGACLDVSNDSNNCGACGAACPAAQPDCSNGTCTCFSGDCGGTGTGGAQGTGGGDNTGGQSSSTGGQSGNVDNPPPLQNPQNSHATHYWDCCKPTCAWPNSGTARTCDGGNQTISDPDTQSACAGGSAYQCWNMAPWAVSDTLAYGFTAFNDAPCGTCFQIEFTGTTSSNYDDPGSAAISNKVMIVQVLNTGGISHFDLLVPGGGVGDFDACSNQWNAHGDLGDRYGGFFTQCRSQNPGNHAGAQQCARDKCQQVFGGGGMDDLLNGCLWWVDWAHLADNPNLRYGRVDCPAAISGVSGM